MQLPQTRYRSGGPWFPSGLVDPNGNFAVCDARTNDIAIGKLESLLVACPRHAVDPQ